MSSWTFLTNHAHVLLCVASNPGARLREIAAAVGITERAAKRIVDDLEDAGYLSKERTGRRNRYTVHPERPFRHPSQAHRSVGVLLEVLAAPRPIRES